MKRPKMLAVAVTSRHFTSGVKPMAQTTQSLNATPMTREQIRHLTDEVFLAAFNAPSGMNPEGVLLYRHGESAPAAIDMLQRMERALLRGLNVEEQEHPNMTDVQVAVPLLETRLEQTCVALDRMQDSNEMDDNESPELARLLERRETLEWVLESLKVPAVRREVVYGVEAVAA
jgi:hypothetical protein